MAVLSKNKTKFIKSLHLKKYRKQEQLFLVEGAKSILELINADYGVIMLIATQKFLSDYPTLQSDTKIKEIYSVSNKELQALSTLKTNYEAMAVANMPVAEQKTALSDQWWLALDDIRDPGNLGTIIRTADWYGFNHIVASTGTSEVYNPKTIQASMGSFMRVHLQYEPLPDFFRRSKRAEINIYGAALKGNDIHHASFSGTGGVVVIGNESNGISPENLSYIDHTISIPRYGSAESLNAAVATAIICDNIRRKSL